MKSASRSITVPLGFQAAGISCGMKPSNAPDLALITSVAPARISAVFTQNSIVGAPITVGRAHVKTGKCNAIIINSGIANVSTGQRGVNSAIKTCKAVAKQLDCDPHHILPSSTGIIGHQLPFEKIETGIKQLTGKLSRGKTADDQAARAIMTTDTRPKSSLRKIKIGAKTISIGGIAKGSGMIAPDMATMLSFITTDADISLPLLRSALTQAVNADASFNRISVDSDTSTSDTVAIIANGCAKNKPIRTKTAAYNKFAKSLTQLCKDLAYQVISDGEGVNHVIRVIVDGAKTSPDALRIARSVADSPLVKTAIHGCDPNWGRIAMAVGKSGAKIKPDKLTIRIGNIPVFRNGNPANFNVKAVTKLMKKPEVILKLSPGTGGKGSCEFLGCDLSRKYITINADYHT